MFPSKPKFHNPANLWYTVRVSFFGGVFVVPERLVLASSSPRRRQLLDQAGIPHDVFAPAVDEHCDLPIREAVAVLSRRKAEASAREHPGRFVLAADTLVGLGEKILGKPADEADACRMLRLLSGKTHVVCTGVTVISPEGKVFSDVDVSHVTFDPMTEEEIRAYVATGDPLDKAGSYGVQGQASLYISRIEGSFFGVMGLPLYLCRRLLRESGYPALPGYSDEIK